jgi:hypothetical protein
MSGNDGEEVTPVPMPNTEVKLFSADGSWGIPPVRVGRCQARPLKGAIILSDIIGKCWPVGQAVKTPPFHGGNTGSNPVRVTNLMED